MHAINFLGPKHIITYEYNIIKSLLSNYRPTNKPTVENKGQGNSNAGKSLEVGIADDQAKDFDFEKTEMKYDSTGMFHWTPARSIEDCILDRNQVFTEIMHTKYYFR